MKIVKDIDGLTHVIGATGSAKMMNGYELIRTDEDGNVYGANKYVLNVCPPHDALAPNSSYRVIKALKKSVELELVTDDAYRARYLGVMVTLSKAPNLESKDLFFVGTNDTVVCTIIKTVPGMYNVRYLCNSIAFENEVYRVYIPAGKRDPLHIHGAGTKTIIMPIITVIKGEKTDDK